MRLDDLLDEATLPDLDLDPAADDAALADVTRRGRRRRHNVATVLIASVLTVVVASVVIVDRLDDRPHRGLVVTNAPRALETPRVFRHEESTPDGHAAIVRGTVLYRDDLDCFVLQGDDGVEHPVVWPYGTEPTTGAGPGVVLPDGQVVHPGDGAEGGGGYVDGEAFGVPDACAPADGDSAVFNSQGPIEVEPSAG
jgi:hypothetical protein